MPSIFELLDLGKFYEGFLTYHDLTERPESGQLYEAARQYAIAWSDAQRIIARRNQANGPKI